MATKELTIAEQAAALGELAQQKAEADAEAARLKTEFDQAERDLFERMRHERVDSIKVDGTNYVTADTVYGSVQDRSEFIRWAEENQPELLETKERKKLVNELVRTHLDNGQLLPPGLGFYTKEYISKRA